MKIKMALGMSNVANLYTPPSPTGPLFFKVYVVLKKIWQ